MINVPKIHCGLITTDDSVPGHVTISVDGEPHDYIDYIAPSPAHVYAGLRQEM